VEAPQRGGLVSLRKAGHLFAVWHFLVRYFAPAAVLLVILHEAGLFS
jgi:hypothetical protein